MIKNIVFDLGNVLVKFKPMEFLEDLFTDQNVISFLFTFYFKGNLWNQYDQGLLNKEEMIEKGTKIHPEYVEQITLMMNKWVEYVVEVESSIQQLKKYKDQYDLYILSNLPDDYYKYVEEHLSIFSYIHHGIYSFQEKLIKPDICIYQKLLDKYSLEAKECLFIDDKLENIEAAKSLGFQTIHLTEISNLEQELMERL